MYRNEYRSIYIENNNIEIEIYNTEIKSESTDL